MMKRTIITGIIGILLTVQILIMETESTKQSPSIKKDGFLQAETLRYEVYNNDNLTQTTPSDSTSNGTTWTWALPYPSDPSLFPSPCKGNTIGFDVLYDGNYQSPTANCFLFVVTIVASKSADSFAGNDVLSSFTVFNETLCYSQANITYRYAISPCVFQQKLVGATLSSQDCRNNDKNNKRTMENELAERGGNGNVLFPFLGLLVSIGPAPKLSYNPAGVLLSNVSVAFVQTYLSDEEWKTDANPLCQSDRYYVSFDRKHPSTEAQLFYTNYSHPGLGIASIGGCLPDKLGLSLATYQERSTVKLSSNGILGWKVGGESSKQEIPKGSVSFLVEINPNIFPKICENKIRFITDGPKKPSAGVIVGATIGSIACFVILVVILYFYLNGKKASQEYHQLN